MMGFRTMALFYASLVIVPLCLWLLAALGTVAGHAAAKAALFAVSVVFSLLLGVIGLLEITGGMKRR